MAVLPVSVSGLILIHEVHIDRVIRNLPVKLGMQMQKRLSVLL